MQPDSPCLCERYRPSLVTRTPLSSQGRGTQRTSCLLSAPSPSIRSPLDGRTSPTPPWPTVRTPRFVDLILLAQGTEGCACGRSLQFQNYVFSTCVSHSWINCRPHSHAPVCVSLLVCRLTPRPLARGCPQEGSLNACNHPSFPSTPSTVGLLDSTRPAPSVILSSISWPAVLRSRTCCRFAASSFVIYSSLLKASRFVSLFSSRRLSPDSPGWLFSLELPSSADPGLSVAPC